MGRSNNQNAFWNRVLDEVNERIHDEGVSGRQRAPGNSPAFNQWVGATEALGEFKAWVEEQLREVPPAGDAVDPQADRTGKPPSAR